MVGAARSLWSRRAWLPEPSQLCRMISWRGAGGGVGGGTLAVGSLKRRGGTLVDSSGTAEYLEACEDAYDEIATGCSVDEKK